MFKIMVVGRTMSELKDKLVEAAEHMAGPQQIVTREPDDVEEMYQNKAAAAPQPEEPDEVPSYELVAPGDLDSRGMPWDERIHSNTRAKNKDGSWRYRRGVEDDVISKVEGELRVWASNHSSQAGNAPPAASLNFPPPAESPVAGLPPAPVAPIVVPPPPPPISTSPAVPFIPPVVTPIAAPPPVYENIAVPQTATKPAHTFETFRLNLIPVLTQLVSTGAITQPYIESLKEYFQVKEIWDVAKDDEKAQELFNQFVIMGFITKVG